MEKIIVWHNPRCSKSRNAIAYLEEKEISYEVFKYMDEKPSKEEIKKVLKLLNINLKEWIRTKETIYKELNLKDVKDEELLIEAMSENPKLIERPVIINKHKAVIARPLENIDKIL